MRVIYGRPALEKLVGKSVVKEAMASTRFREGERKQVRADWWPYCYQAPDGEWVVGCEDPLKLQRSGRFSDLRGVEAAKRWGNSPGPYAPPHPTYTPAEWKSHDPATLLAIDVEGQIDNITRVSLATPEQCGTYSWDSVARQLTQDLCAKAQTIIGWNVGYDVEALREEGLEVIGSGAVLDLMTAHQTLNPWRNRGLGKAAPLYAPLEPWKHKMEGDSEEYALRDAANLIPVYLEIQSQLVSRHQWNHYVNLDMPAYWALREMESKDVKTNQGRVSRSFVSRRNGKHTTETKAAWLMESDPPIGRPGSPAGKAALELDQRYRVYRIRDATRRIVSCLAGAAPRDRLLLRRLLGYGPQQCYKGTTDGLDPLPTDLRPSEIDEKFNRWLSKNKWARGWFVRLEKQIRMDGYVVNPFGRRCYDTRQPQRWVVESTVADVLRLGMSVLPHAPDHLLPDGWALEDQTIDLPALLAEAPWPLESLKTSVLKGLQ